MAKVHVSTMETIRAPRQRVWELVSDTSRYAEWVEGTVEVTRTDGPARLGSTYEEKNRLVGPIGTRSRWKVVEYDPPRRQVHRDESIPFTRSIDLVIETEDAGRGHTAIVFMITGESRLGIIGALAVRLLGPRLAKANHRNAARFRELVERETAVHG